MALREINLGGDTDFINAFLVWMIKKVRNDALSEARNYQHRSRGCMSAPFMSVYAGGKEGEEARQQINFNYAVFPEDFVGCLPFWIDKIIVVHDDGVHLQDGGKSTRVAILVVRWPDWVFRSEDRVCRYRVKLQYHFADNGNRWPKEPVVEELGEYDPIEVATQEVLAG